VEDGTTVPIYAETRLAKLELPEELKAWMDEEFEEVAGGNTLNCNRYIPETILGFSRFGVP
jgi:type I site-specific restriction-modification system R (restriction) subunit